MMSEKTKVKAYGLILPQKKSEQIKPKPAQLNVFGNDSDEDEKPSIHGSIFGPNSGPSKIKRQAQVDIDKALLEDPNIYEYDAVYDEVQASKPKVGAKDKDKNNTDKKPKYIMGLLKAAEQKKKEEEKRKERKVQKEREAEGEMFADKEKFVTSAYKQKMLEMQEEDEKERRVAAFEVMTDVTKQKDMSGFYRYLYRETTGDQAKTHESVNQEQANAGSAEVKVEPDDSPRQKPRSSPGTPSSSAESASSGDSATEAAVPKNKSGLFKANRPTTSNNYRKRKADSSDSDENRENSKGRKSSQIKKRHSLSRSKSRSPHRSKNDRNYSRKDSNQSQVVSRRRSKSHSSSPVVDRRKREKSRSREKIKKGHSRESSRKNKHQRSRSRERSRKSRSPSREKLRRSRSREKSRRSRSRDRSKKSQSSGSKSNIERGGRSKSDLDDLSRKHKSSRSSSSVEDHGQEKLRHKPTDEAKSQTLGKPEIKKKDKGIGKSQKGDSEISSAAKASMKDDTDRAEKDKPGKSGNGNFEKPADKPAKPIPVDPARKVYPHHNSLKDIEEARKRYLQRKAAREGVA
ncbi:hypothetical protein BsWGS_21338 [Bradybaena similaris]